MPAAIITTRGREASLTILTSGYTPAGPVTMLLVQLGHTFIDADTVADVAGDEISATGYTRQLVAFDAIATQADGSVTQKSQPVNFGVVGGIVDATVVGCYLFYDSGNDATSIVWGCVEFVTPQTTDGTDLRVTPQSFAWSPSQF
jgi:hypothetical protein